jgi:hypothetical protein
MRLMGLAVMLMISRSRPKGSKWESHQRTDRHAKIISVPLIPSTAASVGMHHRDYLEAKTSLKREVTLAA